LARTFIIRDFPSFHNKLSFQLFNFPAFNYLVLRNLLYQLQPPTPSSILSRVQLRNSSLTGEWGIVFNRRWFGCGDSSSVLDTPVFYVEPIYVLTDFVCLLTGDESELGHIPE
jgi:hypothetical protein